MPRKLLLPFAILLSMLVTAPADAQEWRPSWREMPPMPTMGELSGNWLGGRGNWFAGTAAISGAQPSALNAVGQARAGAAEAQVVHFNSGPLPAVIWQDRNGDSRADIVEVYRDGGLMAQVIDADYDGRANVLRHYDSSGSLTSEERL